MELRSKNTPLDSRLFFGCRASLRATHYLLEGLAPSEKVIARGHHGWRTGTATSFLST
jgi:hypothetical protein